MKSKLQAERFPPRGHKTLLFFCAAEKKVDCGCLTFHKCADGCEENEPKSRGSASQDSRGEAFVTGTLMDVDRKRFCPPVICFLTSCLQNKTTTADALGTKKNPLFCRIVPFGDKEPETVVQRTDCF